MSDIERENQKDSRRAKVERRVIARRTDSGCDFYLPDYMGDIKRILHYSAQVLPAGQFVGDNEVSFSGVVAYSVLYLDGENKLTEASFTSDFELSEAIGEDFSSASIKSEASSLAVRAAGARKISAKTSVSSDIYILIAMDMPTIDYGVTLEKRSRDIRVRSSEYVEPKEFEYAERAELLSGVSAEEIEEVMSFGKANVTDCGIESGGIRIFAEISAGCILRVRGEEYIRIERKIPAEVNLECEHGNAVCDVSADALLSSVSIGVTNDVNEEGIAGASIVFNVVCEYSARLDGNAEYKIITDAFAPGKRCEYNYKDLLYDEYLCSLRTKHIKDFKLNKDNFGENIPSEVIFKDVKARQTSMKLEGTDAVVEGEISVTLICLNENKSGYVTVKDTLPFALKQRIDVRGSADIDCHIDVGAPEIILDEQATLSLEIYLNVIACKKCRVSALYEVKELGEGGVENCKDSVIVYYPRSTDTLWEVAKRYGAYTSGIALSNNLNVTASVEKGEDILLSDVKMLLIKRP